MQHCGFDELFEFGCREWGVGCQGVDGAAGLDGVEEGDLGGIGGGGGGVRGHVGVVCVTGAGDGCVSEGTWCGCGEEGGRCEFKSL